MNIKSFNWSLMSHLFGKSERSPITVIWTNLNVLHKPNKRRGSWSTSKSSIYFWNGFCVISTQTASFLPFVAWPGLFLTWKCLFPSFGILGQLVQKNNDKQIIRRGSITPFALEIQIYYDKNLEVDIFVALIPSVFIWRIPHCLTDRQTTPRFGSFTSLIKWRSHVFQTRCFKTCVGGYRKMFTTLLNNNC